jgi:hypothetical protein
MSAWSRGCDNDIFRSAPRRRGLPLQVQAAGHQRRAPSRCSASTTASITSRKNSDERPEQIRLLRIRCCCLHSWPAYPVLAKEAVSGMSERVFKPPLGGPGVSRPRGLRWCADGPGGGSRAQEHGLRARPRPEPHRLHLVRTGSSWTARVEPTSALALEELPNSMLRHAPQLTLGQVNLVGENYAAAERYLRQLLALPGTGHVPSNQVLLAAALIGQERYADALPPLLSAAKPRAKPVAISRGRTGCRCCRRVLRDSMTLPRCATWWRSLCCSTPGSSTS